MKTAGAAARDGYNAARPRWAVLRAVHPEVLPANGKAHREVSRTHGASARADARSVAHPPAVKRSACTESSGPASWLSPSIGTKCQLVN
jgi:hypothetical protein